MDLARQEHKWAEAAAQSAAIMSAEQEAELLEEWRVVLAELMAGHMADAQVAGFLETEEVVAETGGQAVGTGETVLQEAAAAEELAVTVVEAVAAEESAGKSDEEADNEDKAPVMPKRAPTAGSSGQSPVVIKRASKSSTPSKQRVQKVVPQYKPLTTTTFTNAQLCNLLVPHRDEVVLNAGHQVGENVLGVKGKKTAPLAARHDCKLRKGLCDKCWANNDPKSCWACTIAGMKLREHGKVDLHVQHNFEKVVLVRQMRAFVVAQRQLVAAGGKATISAASLALPTTQASGSVIDVMPLEPSTPKEKGKAKAVETPYKQRASTPGDEWPAKQSRSGTASQKGTKAVVWHWEETSPVVGPSWEIIPIDLVEKVLPLGSMVLSNPELPSKAKVQSDHEEVAELSDLSKSLSEVLAVPLHAVQPNWVPLPIPHVNGQEFLWLGKALDYPISALCPFEYIEAAKEKTVGMAKVMWKDMQAAAAEIEGL
ncbi:hypothetical protein C0992_007973 [Termitomyces sp. T32_za158]|nr:hypothetical protein C0992_007973 [Termitomyces sp. T32_za158]